MEILVKEGWYLNTNDKVVNSILRRCKENDGYCPCHQDAPKEDTKCPCKSYLDQDKCHCGLYKKKE